MRGIKGEAPPLYEQTMKNHPKLNIKKRPSTAGFTLLELLVVVSILAAVAFITTGTFKNIGVNTNESLVYAEMQHVATAIRRFKQDTGYYPKTGPFDLNTGTGVIDPGDLADFGASGELADWFYSPANLYQLLSTESPLIGTDHTLKTYDPATGRGWRGPYLNGFGDGKLVIGDDLNDGTAKGDPEGSPDAGAEILDVWGIADPFEQRRYEGDTLYWVYLQKEENDAGNEVIEKVPYDYKGRPYLVFGLTTSPWIVSMGPDGEYSSTTNVALGDDIILNMEGMNSNE